MWVEYSAGPAAAGPSCGYMESITIPLTAAKLSSGFANLVGSTLGSKVLLQCCYLPLAGRGEESVLKQGLSLLRFETPEPMSRLPPSSSSI